jgi:hypothetical protein
VEGAVQAAAPADLEFYLDNVHAKRRKLAMWLVSSSTAPSFEWNPLSLVYGAEGLFHRLYCQRTSGYIC